ncbi:hypothetical protein KNT64_gp112 [Pseudomonas phage PspYZU05]|uniref:Uncharacterized protein n=1 Tax=Pseudomonas phage PspYZU05 TaxID=1983556 RepID=A0A2U7NJI9_9CAUD|nr:hypothetical protein KNT64_gp112 [Pseudomonas phage PspYZU05]ASD52064.1 hypothetical protein PspYZU05_112 [Pseudomonas phage PspYZU05]
MNILPIESELADVQEYADVSQVFSVELQATERLISMEIIHEDIQGLTFTDTGYSGKYEAVFSVGPNSLMYRDQDKLKSADSWEQLPPGKELYLWNAPKSLLRTYTYTVKVKYATTDGVTETEAEMSKQYTQIVFGNWSVWANKLRDYIWQA